ncbi:cytidine deaminase [Pontiella agarivorans]|uniref:Cytidine deaminase n=1 Tax=Pontiella agarivorans TaxID=3038953 RepID=A0ABU5N0A7_9BACT|nr:cytidine deaminase [Pontiella agarivorans]MDZ8119863.1 cytidine deaminase [Pontiella agarivorans]
MTPEKLILRAFQALEHAHAPYSGYAVGAALQCEDGTVFTGCNVENASYGLTNCAERSAVFSAISGGHKSFTAIAIASSAAPPPFPCGACRQVLAEFCSPGFKVYIADGDGFQTVTLGELLPHAFDLGDSNA